MALEELLEVATPNTTASLGVGQVPDFDDLESLASPLEDLNIDEIWNAGEGDEIKISGFTVERGDRGYESDTSGDEASSIESSYSSSNYSDDASDEEEEEDDDDDD